MSDPDFDRFDPLTIRILQASIKAKGRLTFETTMDCAERMLKGKTFKKACRVMAEISQVLS